MNILPKKRWHVRTKDNIARVRRDEAEAAEKEKERLHRAKLAEQEARTAFLRSKVRSNDRKEDDLKHSNSSGKKLELPKKIEADIYTADGNINFFKDLELGKQTDGTNKEYEEEKKAEQEKYEKRIGYLTYLGQDSLEATGSKAWYELKSGSVAYFENSSEVANEEVGLKSKAKLDPINDIIKYTGLKPLKKVVPGISAKVETSLKRENGVGDKVIQSKQEKKQEYYSDDQVDCKKGLKKKKKKGKHSKKKIRDRDNVKHRKKCKDKNTEISRNRKRKRSNSNEDVYHHKGHKKRRSSDSSSSSDSFTDSNELSSTESTDETQYQREKQKKLEVLRAERLKRETEERRRAERLLAGKKPNEEEEVPVSKPVLEQKYHSQFNPHLARQNQEPRTLQAGVKYWLQ